LQSKKTLPPYLKSAEVLRGKDKRGHFPDWKKGFKDKPFTIVNSKFEVTFDAVTFRQNVYPLKENKPRGPIIVNKYV
jgi:hypothetical protein